MVLGYISMLKPPDCVALVEKINRLPVVKGNVAICFKCKTELRNKASGNVHVRVKPNELKKEVADDVLRAKNNQLFKKQLKRIIQKTSIANTPEVFSTEDQSSRISLQQSILIQQLNMKRSQSSEGTLGGNRQANNYMDYMRTQHVGAGKKAFLTNAPQSLKSITSAHQTSRGYSNIN